MIPEVVADHVDRAKARLTGMFEDRQVIEGLVSAWVKRYQRAEDELWKIILGRNLEGDGIVLDIIGQIVMEPRADRSDDDYREALRIRILINRSEGKQVDLLKILSVAARGAPWDYWDSYPAAFGWFFAGSASAWKALKTYMKEAKAGGVGAEGYYLPTASATKGLRYSSTVGTAALATAFGSTTGGGPDTVYAHTGV